MVRIEIITGGFNLNYRAARASPPPAARVASHEKPVEGLSSPGRISIYPNPTENSFINIEFSGLEDKAALQIYTLQGQLVWDLILTKDKTLIALDDIKPGIYTMRIMEKTSSSTKKIVVK